MTEEAMNKGYTHMDYRKAKIIHLVERSQEERFIYKGRTITKEEADEIVETHLFVSVKSPNK